MKEFDEYDNYITIVLFSCNCNDGFFFLALFIDGTFAYITVPFFDMAEVTEKLLSNPSHEEVYCKIVAVCKCSIFSYRVQKIGKKNHGRVLNQRLKSSIRELREFG